jgi:two-component system, sensor histidine kinase and response regulator
VLSTRYGRVAALQMLAMPLAQGDCNRVSGVAHKLKSAARSVGAVALGELCAKLENTRVAADAVSAQRLSDTLENTMRRTSAAVQERLAALTA